MIKLRKVKKKDEHSQRNSITATQQEQIFQRYEKFLARILYSTSTNFDQIHPDHQLNVSNNVFRMIKISTLKFLSLLFLIRCWINILFPNEFTQNLTCNGYHYLGNSVMINLGYSAGVWSGTLMLGLAQQYLIFTGESYQFSYMNKIKYRGLVYRLNKRFNNKFYRIFNWISRGVYPQFVQTFFIVTILY